ncbi:major facilitator superfamily domain-containing protein [Morchella snyderi]|nr:major facilitator superfamily domain-containing protein [Morchella snyderi]
MAKNDDIISSSLDEKDIESGIGARKSGYGNDIDSASSTTSSSSDDYAEGVTRIATLVDPDITRIATKASRASGKSGRTAKDLESVLGTEFEVKWEGPNDPQNALNWATKTKALILGLVSLQTWMVVFYSTSYVSGSPGIMKEFGITSKTIATLGMTTYMLGLAAGPLVLAPMSELYGRRPVYLISLSLFFILVLPACLAQNFATILIVRFLGAFAGSVTISNAPGTIGDIFDEHGRTMAITIFSLAPMNGPVLGPIIGGLVYGHLGWRWTSWLVFIIAGVLGVLAFFIPETYTPVLMRKKAARLRKETGDDRYMSRFCYKDGEGDFWVLIKTSLQRPIIMLFTEPLCIFWALYIAVIYGILYLCFTAYPIVFAQIRGWGPSTAGLAFCGIGVGTILSAVLDPVNQKIYEMHKVDPDTGKRPPEARIACTCLAAVLSPAAMFWFAWTCVPTSIHWIWPILSGIPFGLGNTWIFLHGNSYLITSYDVYAASALAGNTVTRSILGGILPLFGPQLYSKLGPNWAATTVGFISMALIPIPWGFYKWGKQVRIRSPMLQRLQKERQERGEE